MAVGRDQAFDKAANAGLVVVTMVAVVVALSRFGMRMTVVAVVVALSRFGMRISVVAVVVALSRFGMRMTVIAVVLRRLRVWMRVPDGRCSIGVICDVFRVPMLIGAVSVTRVA